MIPYVKNNPTKSLNLHDFSGGVNYGGQKTHIKDNQLTDVKNMWFQKGALKTRPAVEMAVKGQGNYGDSSEINVDKMNEIIINGKSYLLEMVKELLSGSTNINLRFIGEKDCINLGRITIDVENAPAFAVIFKDDVFLFVGKVNKIYKITKQYDGTYSSASVINETDIYAPLVLTNCWPCYNDSGKINAMLLKGADIAESFNLLSNRYRMCFSQYDAKDYIEVNTGESASRISYMEYGLPYTKVGTKGEIYLEYTCFEGFTHVHSVSCPQINEPTVESNVSDDGLYMHAYVKGDVCHVTLNSSAERANYNPDYVSVEKYINNNLYINAPRYNPEENWEKVTLMTQKVWYGNNSLGVNGGSRLFLGGNNKEKALLVWSDFENPLYFPENNYAYVGDNSQKITALGRMGAELVIFKEREIYSTQYVYNEDSITNGAFFPMALIHPEIGCNHPESIQLVRNRLVFFDKGRVYTISENNQYSERNVYPISEVISSVLSKYADNLVFSADWQGYYLLFIENSVFLMDYNTYGYVNIHSTNKTDVANNNIPWYLWELQDKAVAVKMLNNELYLWVKENSTYSLMKFNDEVNEDYSAKDNKFKKITSLLETKHFDFGNPDKYKIIEKVSFDALKDNKLTLTFITDEIIFDSHSMFLNSLVPESRYIKTLGIRLETTGRLLITSVKMRYRLGF